MTKMAAMLLYGKTFENLLRNQMADDMFMKTAEWLTGSVDPDLLQYFVTSVLGLLLLYSTTEACPDT